MLSLPTQSINELLVGLYQLDIFSDGIIKDSVVRVTRTDDGDQLALYRGAVAAELSSPQYFGPFCDQDSLVVWNTSTQSGGFAAAFYDLNGAPAGSDNRVLAPLETVIYNQASVANLEDDFCGLAVITSNLSFTGLLLLTSKPPAANFFELQTQLNSATDLAAIPRMFKAANEGGETRTSTLFVGDIPDDLTYDTDLLYRDTNGAIAFRYSLSFSDGGGQFIDLSAHAPVTGTLWAGAFSDPGFLISTADYTTVYTYSSGTYWHPFGTSFALPYVTKASDSYTVISLFNPNATQTGVLIKYYSADGGLKFSHPISLPAYGWQRYNLRERPELGYFFTGSVDIVAAHASIQAWVDEYQVPVPPSYQYLPLAVRNDSPYFLGPWEREPNNTYLEANGLLYFNQDYYGYPNDAKDYFSFQLAAAQTIAIDLTNYTGGDGQLQLYYQTVDNLVIYDPYPPYHIDYNAASGWYYVKVDTGSNFNNVYPYTLRVSLP
jgi:hypothetical protein